MLLLVDESTQNFNDHEYHEISDEDTIAESPGSEVSLFLIKLSNIKIKLQVYWFGFILAISANLFLKIIFVLIILPIFNFRKYQILNPVLLKKWKQC